MSVDTYGPVVTSCAHSSFPKMGQLQCDHDVDMHLDPNASYVLLSEYEDLKQDYDDKEKELDDKDDKIADLNDKVEELQDLLERIYDDASNPKDGICMISEHLIDESYSAMS